MAIAPVNILTRLAITHRAQTLLSQINNYFDDVAAAGLTAKEADPDNALANIRKGLIAMLDNEARIRADRERG